MSTLGPCHVLLALAAVGLLGCTGRITGPGGSTGEGAALPVPGQQPSMAPGTSLDGQTFRPAPLGMRRLTREQYANAVQDLLGTGLTLPSDLDADDKTFRFASVGSYRVTSGPDAVERASDAAFDLAQQVFSDATLRMTLVGCTPAAASDACVQGFVQKFGRLALRRPLASDELTTYLGVVQKGSAIDQSAWTGLEYFVAAVLQDPYFLYVPELGEEAPERPGLMRYSALEMASRLSLALVGSSPDPELLDAAERGELANEEALRTHARRLLSSAGARRALPTFFAEHLEYDDIEQASKDDGAYPTFSEALARSMRTELDKTLTELALGPGQDFMRAFTTKQTWLNRDLAQLYGVTGPTGDAFELVTLPDSTPRQGLLTMAGILANHALATRTSPTQRGVFVRERILCQDIPAPPPNVDVNLAEPVAGAPASTTRERVAQHRADPACAACHAFFDPIGLSFEHYDAIGAYRDTENGKPIDASADLDGKPLDGALELGQHLALDPRASACLVQSLYQYAAGRLEIEGITGELQGLDQRFSAGGHVLGELMVDLVSSPAFRYASRSE
jgi:hypothetical protein